MPIWEPNAGSDLAAIQTRAVKQGDNWVINGQKIWTTYAHLADKCFLLARTENTGKKHEGITAFLVDMHQEVLKLDLSILLTTDMNLTGSSILPLLMMQILSEK